MKKLIWSAFAMSLFFTLLPAMAVSEGMDDFLGLEKEILPELSGPQKFSPRNLHEKQEWNVEEKQVEVDAAQPLKGQKHSLISWDSQKPEDFLSIDKWLLDRQVKDETPEWKIRLRHNRHSEIVGKILQCRGTCEVYRGVMKARVHHLSQIREGDELVTSADTIAWVYLMDGTLVRVAPSTNLSFLEINWSKDEVLYVARIHQGQVYWHKRDQALAEMDLNPETDAISLPLMVREANLGFYERKIFQKQNDTQRSEEVLRLEDTAIVAQTTKLNELKAKNNEVLSPRRSKVMLVAPNATVVTFNSSFDFFHFPGGKSYLKKRSHLESHDMSLELRGYSDNLKKPITDLAWIEIEPNGRSFKPLENVTGEFTITELITKRIKTIELAREIWMEKFTLPIIKASADPKQFAIDFGYTFWDEKLEKRFDFLVEYTRRIETTNLKSMENLLNKVGEAGAFSQKDISDSHYSASLNYYLRNLKTRYTDKKMQVREMNDLQYYIWILRHGKQKI